MKKNFTREQLTNLAKDFGTPLFIVQKDIILDNIEKFRSGFSRYKGGFTLCYSSKTNPQLGILNIMKGAGVIAEVCSFLDLSAALKVGFKGEDIIYHGLVKTDEELILAAKNEVKIIHLEALDEAVRLNDIAQKNNLIVNVGIRLAFPAKTGIKSLLGVTYDRFGASVKSGEAQRIAEFIIKSKNLKLGGLHCHTGSNQKIKDNYLVGVRVVIDFMKFLRDSYNHEIAVINLGGGVGIQTIKPYRIIDLALNSFKRILGFTLHENLKPFNFLALSRDIVDYLEKKLDENSLAYPRLMMEPGRALVGSSADLLLKVVNIKETERNNWIIVDGGTNLLPILTLFSEYHNIEVISNSNIFRRASVAGPLLYSADVLVANRILPAVSRGDLVVVHDIGAYCNSQANQFLYPRAATVIIDDNGTHIIQRRETVYDVLVRDEF